MNKKVWEEVNQRSNNLCEECNRPYPQKHHAFNGSRRDLLEMTETVFDLCYYCHEGDEGVHHNRELDLKYKGIATQNLLNIGWSKEKIMRLAGRWYLD